MLAISPRSALPVQSPENSRLVMNHAIKGYTLLELLVVLSLVGFITAIALPNLVTLSERIASRLQLEDIVTDINSIGFKAFQDSRAYQLGNTGILQTDVPTDVLNSSDAYPLDLPDGWQLSVDTPIHYKSNGICLGGELRLHHLDELILNEMLRTPFCQIDAT